LFDCPVPCRGRSAGKCAPGSCKAAQLPLPSNSYTITMGPRPKRGAAKAAAEEESKKAKSGLAVGDQLPDFELQNDEEQTMSSADLVRPRDQSFASPR
jgi:hypothetical protein